MSLLLAVSNGTTFSQAVDGTLSFGGSVTARTNKAIAGALAFASGSLTVVTAKALAGALSFSSGVLIGMANKALSGALSFSSDMAFNVRKAVSGNLSFSSVLTTIGGAASTAIVDIITIFRRRGKR